MRLPADRAMRAVAKLGVENMLWGGASLMSRGDAPLPEPLPPVEPTAVMQDDSQWQDAVRLARERRLPLHHDRPKNWDTAGAAATVLSRVGPNARVLDAGAARYSTLLVWLYRYGLRQLVGINLEFRRPVHHGRNGCVLFTPGDATDTGFDAESFDAITCLSVIEHGVPIAAFLSESARLLRPGGLLVISTDYDIEPPDTTGRVAYGAPVHIFGPDEIVAMIAAADAAGFDLDGTFVPQHSHRPVRWKRYGLQYTFVRLTFVRRSTVGRPA